ncbi:P-loop containing nucleoside triphosphate hydrolase protein [Chytriomyces sp. MP71]|nr:P-loop containing nucleoside triphosphate hydrolase protein [Chytriomyces sp. MP71]
MDLVAQFQQLLAVERRTVSEEERNLNADPARVEAIVRSGNGVKNLSVESVRTGLGGKNILTLRLRGPVSHQLRAGDNVALILLTAATKNAGKDRDKDKENGVFPAVLAKASADSIAAVLDADPDETLLTSGNIAAVKVSSDVPFKRMTESLSTLEKVLGSTQMAVPLSSTLMNILLGVVGSNPTFASPPSPRFLNPFLNDSQRDAVIKCLSANHISLIHGPPGTGKTETVVELVRQLVARGDRVLLCGPSNISVDTLAARLTPHLNTKLSMTRIGHPSRVRRDQVLDHVLDIRVRSSDEGKIANDVRDEMDKTLVSIQKCKRKSERRALYDELKKLRLELREREKKVVADVLASSNVIAATLSGCGSNVLRGQLFDSVVIDESSQAIEAGDHLQLPPTVKSSSVIPSQSNKSTSKLPQSLTCTLFDRMLALYGDTVKSLLTTQYRMNELIMQFPSDHLYKGQLKAHDSVQHHLLKDLPEVQETDETTSAFTFLNTSLCGFQETTPDSLHPSLAPESLQNVGEATLVELHVSKLIAAGVNERDIAVITPYSAQVRLLQTLLHPRFPGLEVGTVDSFQGAEREAVVVSLVRGNETGEVGFLADVRRLNVAVTRARRHLCVVFDDRMKRGNAFLEGMCAFVEEFGDVVFVEG